MKGQLRILRSHTRANILREISGLPDGFEVVLREPKRSMEQNAKLWAILSDISTAKPEGRIYNPEAWKAIFMSALGHEVRFVEGLQGEPIPMGYRSSALRKAQMADLITMALAYGDENGVAWSEKHPDERAA